MVDGLKLGWQVLPLLVASTILVWLVAGCTTGAGSSPQIPLPRTLTAAPQPTATSRPTPEPTRLPTVVQPDLTPSAASTGTAQGAVKEKLERAEDTGTVSGELGGRLDEYLTRITPFGFAGTVLVAKDGEIVLNKGYGMAIRAEGVRNTSDTVFSTGSITKQFTAAAIMVLEMQGKLDTYDPISKYLDRVPEDKADITLHHLLTHTAGVIISSGPDYGVVHRDETANAILSAPLKFTPGEKFEYTNARYTLLAAIVEKVSGQPYEEFLREQLFMPAGMHYTGYRIPKWHDKLVAHWYRGDIDNGTPLEKPYPYWHFIGNGGIPSTTEDMYKWHLALQGDAVLSAGAKEKLFDPFLSNYAYGWDVRETKHGTLIEHNGGSGLGNSAEFMRYVDADVAIIVFTNQFYLGTPLSEAIKRQIVTLVFGGEVEAPPSEVVTAKGPVNLAKFEGSYQVPSGGNIKVSVENDFLTLAGEGQDAINALISPEGGDLAVYDDLNRQSVAMLEAAASGDYGPLAEALADDGPFGEVLEDKQERLYGARRSIDRVQRLAKEITGDDQTIRPMGTLRSPFLESAAKTVVAIEGEQGRVLFGLVWYKILSLGVAESARLVRIPSLPVSESEFAGYNLGIAKNVLVSFDMTDGGSVTGLTAHGEEGAVEARKEEHS